MKPKFAFTVLYAHRGDDATPFMGFHRDDKQRAFDCLRRLSMAWPNTTYWLRKGRKTLVRIERGEIHRSRASAYHQAHMRFKAQMAAIEREANKARPETRTVTIPACAEHDGVAAITVSLPWRCIHCGGPRGEPGQTISWDGSRRLACHGWTNPCGHVEKYSEIRGWLQSHGGALA